MEKNRLIELAIVRNHIEITKAQMKAMVETVTNSPEYKKLQESADIAIQTESIIASDIRQIAEEEYKATGVKQVHENVLVKERVVARIADDNAAREWCFTNFRPALMLDHETFINAIKNKQVPETLGDCFTEVFVTISKDLSKYLPE